MPCFGIHVPGSLYIPALHFNSIMQGNDMFNGGYTGKILRINLTEKTSKEEPLPLNVAQDYIGGAGFGIYYLYGEVAAGRKGLGAVMGAKNLKAISMRGSGSVAVASKEKLSRARGEMMGAMKESPILYSEFSKIGTPSNVDNTCALGIFPAKNWTATGEFTPLEKIGVQALKSRNVGREFCYGCPVGCSQLKLAREKPYKGTLTEGPEFETMYAFGGETGVDNADAIIAADRLADELGLDTISAGVTIGFAMELFEKGILKPSDTEGSRSTSAITRPWWRSLNGWLSVKALGICLPTASRLLLKK